MMKKITNSLLFITGISLFGFSQPTFEWANSIGSSDEDYVYEIVYDSEENSISVGLFSQTIDLDPGPGILSFTPSIPYNSYVQKLDNGGNLLWACSFESSVAYSVVTDAMDNIYVTGFFGVSSGIFDMDPGAGVSNLDVNDGTGFLVKLTSAGNFIWAKSFGGRPFNMGMNSGEISIAGTFNTSGDFDPSAGVYNLTNSGSTDNFVLRLDMDGNFLWAKSFGSSGLEVSRSCDVDSYGNTYVCGSFQNTIDFDPGPGVFNLTASGSSSYLLKLDSNGDLVWVYPMNCSALDLHISVQDDLYVTGAYGPSCDFDLSSGTAIENSVGPSDIFIAKYDLDANFIWVKSFGSASSDAGLAITTDPYGIGVYVSGRFRNALDFDPGPGIFNLTSLGMNDAFICKFLNNGDFVWAGSFGEGWDDYGQSVAVNTSGDIYVVGPFNYTVDFDPGAGIYNISSNANSWDAYTVKLNQCEMENNLDLASLPDLMDECSVSAPVAPTSSNCQGTYTGVPDVTFPVTSQGTSVVTWTYTNNLGITKTQTQNIIINDVTTPVADIGSLSDVTAECQVTSLSAPTSTDNCAGTITGTHNATLPMTTQGTTVVTWTYDDGNGNTSTQMQNVVITDVTAPVADMVMLSDITSECQITSLTAPTATDNCAGSITGTHNASLPITTQGTTVVTWTYNDGNGNTSTQTQNVVIDDITGPVADVATLSNITSECSVTSLTGPTASDNCAGSITGTHDASLPITTQGTTVVTWTYDDGNGNTSTQTQNVVITDVTAPVADMAMLSDITSECEVASLTAPTATDNCAGAITGTHNATLPIASSTTVTWTYDDGNGNISTQNQNVVITPIDNTVTQVDAITLSADASGYTYQWVDCNNGNTAINGATSQTFVASANGNYAVEVSNGMCSVTSSCTVINSVGIEENQLENTFMVYPNPTNGTLYIDDKNHLLMSLNVLNALGQQVEVESIEVGNITSIEIPFGPGVYFLKITTHSEQYVIKITKN